MSTKLSIHSINIFPIFQLLPQKSSHALLTRSHIDEKKIIPTRMILMYHIEVYHRIRYSAYSSSSFFSLSTNRWWWAFSNKTFSHTHNWELHLQTKQRHHDKSPAIANKCWEKFLKFFIFFASHKNFSSWMLFGWMCVEVEEQKDLKRRVSTHYLCLYACVMWATLIR